MIDPIKAFEARVERVPFSGCWLWTGALNKDGYAHLCVKRNSTRVLAHRFSFQKFVGPIPEELEIDHLCRNRCCVNPHHLEAVSHKENVRRAYGPTCRKFGHELSQIKGQRLCLICRRESMRRNYAERRARGLTK